MAMVRLAIWVLLLSLSAGAQPSAPAVKPVPAVVNEAPVVKQHQLTVGSRTLRYTTSTGLMPIRNAQGEVEAHIFYIAYTLDGAPDPSKRKLMFSFNGGPGSSSVWLHLGALGPKRVKMRDDGSLPPPPYELVANEETWLDDTDLVFIDPVGTGYSRPVKPDLQAKFSSRNGDIESVGEFIRLYLSRTKRWTSPLFLVGESYGTTRAAALSGYLIDRGIAFNGIALVSTILSFQTVDFAPANDLAYPLILPTYTATAWYHKRLPADLQKRPLRELLKEVEQWALTGYSEALAKGDRLTAPERQQAAQKLARFTGLDQKLVDHAELRPRLMEFNRELLRDRNLIVGRLDSRITGFGPRDLSRQMEFDPSMSAIRPPYTAAFNQYVRVELGYESDADYHILGGGIGRWNSNAENEYVNVSDSLRRAFTRNPFMKVYLGAGLYDMATPYFAAYYTLDHLGLPAELRGNVRIHEYEAGHMYYVHVDSLRALKQDIAAFLKWSAP
jgi:carboxypeptidase C (cathepsin A)